MTRTGGLGRGLGDLLAATSAPDRGPSPAGVDGSYFAELAVDAITPNPRQPRERFEDAELAELADSIREVGVLQPVVVRPLPEAGRFELVMGERRLRATRLAGKERIPAIVRSTDNTAMLRDALLENLHRAQLNPLEEAAAYSELLTEFGCTQEELAARIKRSRPQISNTIRLLRLPASVQGRLANGELSAGHARALLAVENATEQERLAQRIVAEGLSVRAVEALVSAAAQPFVERVPRSPAAVPSPRASELADRLSSRWGTRVRVNQRGERGRIVIDFASEDDLTRILDRLGD